jgi:hypothetical protein
LNGQVYNQTGTFTQTLMTQAGCDSTIILNLTINQATNSTLTETACGSFDLNGQVYTQSGTFTQVIPNASGCDSTITLNLSITPNSSSSFSETVCDSYTWNAQTYTESGTYEQIFTNSNGCDSTVNLILTITTIDAGITQTDATLTANQADASYQWIDCLNGNMPIEGATSQVFVASLNGQYAVQISLNNCTETSACVTVDNVTIVEQTLNNILKIYPNPAKDEVKVLCSSIGSVIILTDFSGKIVKEHQIDALTSTLDLSHISTGIYKLGIYVNGLELGNEKLVIQK